MTLCAEFNSQSVLAVRRWPGQLQRNWRQDDDFRPPDKHFLCNGCNMKYMWQISSNMIAVKSAWWFLVAWCLFGIKASAITMMTWVYLRMYWNHNIPTDNIWVRSRNCGCLVTWFCYQLIAKPGNKTATVSRPDTELRLSCYLVLLSIDSKTR